MDINKMSNKYLLIRENNDIEEREFTMTETDTQVLKLIIELAINNGYMSKHNLDPDDWTLEEIEENLVDNDLYYSVIFSHDFARHLWGSKMVDRSGFDMAQLQLHFKQIAVRYNDKIYKIEPHLRDVVFAEMETTEFCGDEFVYNLPQIETTTIRLKDICHTIPLGEYKLKKPKISNLIPNYVYHLQIMAAYENPIEYLRKFV